ncbi:NAD(P)-dependent oxidoreductase [Stenotrophomonas maltophilia]|jgi:3-hydroxyisobutyrate dehydrogenase|uniref:NAD(P)-dependent oxidoreductase n=1 Tax=Stenotrophomonas TaxID=40323 RepID=UPI00284C3809|nr:NAD(P)-dependent oxidoreductase [Stenotrophomonas sp.]MDR2961788.1 NAD(P)-dependent oxidoreductase [Stenotrophomonas sp.]
MPVGFIGLGVMGTPMAGHLARAGTAVLGWSRSGRTYPAAQAAGIGVCASLDEVFAACDTLILMLAHDEAIDSVLDRHGAAFRERVQGRLLINMGTSSAAFSQALCEQVRGAGGRYVEAPVSGSRVQAEAAQLVILLAGAPTDIEQATALLAPLGRQCVACGPVPSALRMKLAVNLYLITLVTGLAEAVHFAEKHGIALERFAEVLNAGPMASDVSRIKLDKMIRDDFQVQASITDVLKNSGLVAGAAREAGMHAALIEDSDALFARAQQMGLGRLDMAAVLLAVRAGRAGTDRH